MGARLVRKTVRRMGTWERDDIERRTRSVPGSVPGSFRRARHDGYIFLSTLQASPLIKQSKLLTSLCSNTAEPVRACWVSTYPVLYLLSTILKYKYEQSILVMLARRSVVCAGNLGDDSRHQVADR